MTSDTEPQGFLDRKITAANFGIDPVHTLTFGQLSRITRFLTWQRLPITEGPGKSAIDVIIIPTTSPNIDLESFNRRITAAIKYSHEFPDATVLFAGKRPDLSRATAKEIESSYSEAEVMRNSAIEQGLVARNIELEELSVHTGESIRNTLDMLNNRPIKGLLVTCSSYMARRIGYYLTGELKKRELSEAINTFIFDSDVAEDLAGSPITGESTDRKLRSILYEAKRLSLYRKKGDL